MLYSCNYTRALEEQIKEEKTDRPTHITNEEETYEMIKNILHKEEVACLPEHASIERISCKCNRKRKMHLDEGWEGSAIIAHGSVIIFGCLPFIFNTLNAYVDR